jgi:hypothetical protein
MLWALEEIADFYKAECLSYLYATYPQSNTFVRRLAERAGWDVAGVVRGLYRDDGEILAHRVLLNKPVPVPGSIYLRYSSKTSLARKRGGSVLLRTNQFDAVQDIEMVGRSVARAVRSINRICFSRVDQGVASLLDTDEVIRLVDGTTLVVWR